MSYFYRFKKPCEDENMTIYKIKLDETALLHYLAAIEFRIDYYTKRIDAIHTIKEKIQDNYTQVLKDAQQSLDYHKELKADLLKQKAKGEKQDKMSDDIIAGIDYETHRNEE